MLERLHEAGPKAGTRLPVQLQAAEVLRSRPGLDKGTSKHQSHQQGENEGAQPTGQEIDPGAGEERNHDQDQQPDRGGEVERLGLCEPALLRR
jgi:hypothetical protein